MGGSYGKTMRPFFGSAQLGGDSSTTVLCDCCLGAKQRFAHQSIRTPAERVMLLGSDGTSRL